LRTPEQAQNRDARALCEACELGAYRVAHRSSDAARGRRAHVAVRRRIRRTSSDRTSTIREREILIDPMIPAGVFAD
jgi:hypothetical protein